MSNKSYLSFVAEKLGILVSSGKHLDYVINLTDAAHNKGKSVEIFFTGKGVLLTQSPRIKKLIGKAKMSLCDNSFRALGLEGDVPGFGFKDFATQAKNAEIIKNSDRYVVF
jgi:predicted peroxiredoxin